MRRRRGRIAVRAFVRALGAVLVFAELLHLFLVELVECVHLFLREDLGEGGYAVDAVFEQDRKSVV